MWEYVKFLAMVVGFMGIGFVLFIALWIGRQSYLDWRRDREMAKVIQKRLDRQFGGGGVA